MMIEIISIGNELLQGTTLNTNSVEMSRILFDKGYRVERHTVVADQETAIVQTVQEALARSDVVLCTGGLGPTSDDMTRAAAARCFQSELQLNQGLLEELQMRYGKNVATLQNQATLPADAAVIPNPFGTASGFYFTHQQKLIFFMPGVPSEMRRLFSAHVLPVIEEKFPAPDKNYREWLHFLPLFESDIDTALRILEKENSGIQCGVYPNLGKLSIFLSSPDKKTVEAVKNALLASFGDRAFYSKSGSIVEAVQALLVKRGETLATAESCTGGAIAAAITAKAGASAYYLGGFVSYSNILKEAMLGVSHETLEKKGAVSRETAEEMLNGLFSSTACDWAIAVTGIAGPSGGSDEKPRGTVWAAVGRRGEKAFIWQMRGHGSREMVISYTVNLTLAKLYHKIK